MHAEATLESADRQAREDALDVTRSFIVQAPAGSGKTELLIQRYLRLLANVEDPEEVLAITFTRKAAREMQQRVMQALQQAKSEITPESAHQKVTIDAARDVLHIDAKNDWCLTQSPRRMRIQTLDAFCAGVTRLLPLSSGTAGIGNAIADAEIKAVYRAAAVATFDWLLVDDDQAKSAVANVLRHLDNNSGVFIAYISRMLETRDQWLDITGTGQAEDLDSVRVLLEKNITDVIQRHLAATGARFRRADVAELLTLCAYAGTNLTTAGKTEHVSASLNQLQSLPAGRATDLILWRGICELLLTKKNTWRKTVTKNDGFPAGDGGQKKAWLQLISDLSGDQRLLSLLVGVRGLPNPRYEEQQWSVLVALLRLLPLAVVELKRIFSEQGVIDHVEVAQAAESALGSSEEPGDIALMLDYRIRHLLVDEMQDTSIGQYRLLQKLTAGWEPNDGRTLFCVGDPMQSIYRFRNAEVGQFVLAREKGVSELPLESLTLRQNFRSGASLVHWFNSVFSQIFPDEDDIASGAVVYSESVPAAVSELSGEYHVCPLFDASTDDEANVTADVVEKQLASSKNDDVVVLVRSRTQLVFLLSEFRKRNVDYHAVEIDRLTDLPEIIDLLAITRAYCHLADRTAWLGLLRSPLVGLTWTDLHSLVFEAADKTVWTLINDSERITAKLSLEAQALLAKFVPIIGAGFKIDRVRTLREKIEDIWFRLGGPAQLRNREQLENAYRFLDVLDKIDTAGTLADPAELEQRLDDERISSDAADGCRVQVMTIHKAKGLQFDHVVLPGLGRSTSASKKAVLSWLNLPDESGGSDMIISPVGPLSELENDPLHQYIESQLRHSNSLELDRLLYVACTRARKSLHLIGHVNSINDGVEMGSPHAGSLLNRLWPALEQVYSEAFVRSEPGQSQSETAASSKYLIPPLRRTDIEWALPAPPELPKVGSGDPGDSRNEDAPVEYYWVGTAARHAGTIVHRWLCKFARENKWPDDEALDSIMPLTRKWAKNLRVPDNDANYVFERVRRSLSGILRDEQGQWILKGDGHAELALTGLWRDRTESIVIDRVRIDNHGVHWIIDYKTSTHEGGDLDGFLQQELMRYQEQLQKYATIYRNFSGASVQAALYFPLLQQFRESNISGD